MGGRVGVVKYASGCLGGREAGLARTTGHSPIAFGGLAAGLAGDRWEWEGCDGMRG